MRIAEPSPNAARLVPGSGKPRPELRILQILVVRGDGFSERHGSSLQSLQIRKQSLQIVGCQGIRSHFSARLDALRIKNPAGKSTASVRQSLGGNHVAARQVSQVRTEV